jgi:ABC-type iron transport system FetAB ATPase subunit
VINGFYHPQGGTITFKGTRRHDMRPYIAASQGISRTFQNLALFKGMSTLDNIMAGRALKMRRGLLWQALHWGPALAEEIQHREAVEKIIDFLEIQHIRKAPVGKLPYGLQKRVELGRALAMEPELLLLDEPMAGMNLEEKPCVGWEKPQRINVRSEDHLAATLKHEGDADGRHKQRQSILVDERPKDQTLHETGRVGHHDCSEKKPQRDGAPDRHALRNQEIKRAHQRQPCYQHHRALREVEDARGLEDKHEPERDERVEDTRKQTADQDFQKLTEKDQAGRS